MEHGPQPRQLSSHFKVTSSEAGLHVQLTITSPCPRDSKQDVWIAGSHRKMPGAPAPVPVEGGSGGGENHFGQKNCGTSSSAALNSIALHLGAKLL